MADNIYNGRKVFFLYPHPIVRDLVLEIIKNEYEVYIMDDHVGLKELLAKYKNAIVFINIEDRLREEEWEKYIRQVLADPATNQTGIGVLTYFERGKALTEKYMLDLGINCGFIRLKTGLAQSKDVIIRMLEANEARGKRRFVRGICNPKLDSFNVDVAGTRQSGKVLDISIAGMACQFDSLPKKLEPGTILKDIQLVLRGIRCNLDGNIVKVDRRANESDMYLALFSPASLKPAIKDKIHSFVHICLQDSIANELKRH